MWRPNFQLLRSLVPDGKLDAADVTYASLCKLLKSHFTKKQSVMVHRFNFNTRVRKSSESIAEYIAALRELARNCNFGTTEILEEMLRDRLVCGVNHQGMQRKLLSEGDISYADALVLAQSIEAAEDDIKLLGRSAPSPQVVNFTQRRDKFQFPSPPTSPTCYRCGEPHLAPACPHIKKVCMYCNKIGHLAKVCRTKLRDSRKSHPPGTSDTKPKKPPQKEHYVQQQLPTCWGEI